LKHLSEKHEDLMKVYNGLIDQNQSLNENNHGVQSEYAHLKEEYEFLLKDNPKKLKQIQEDLINKYNRLFKEHSALNENHEKLVIDHENLKKIPIVPRISSTEDLDLILNDQMINSNKIINQELNSLRTYHQELLDEFDERIENKEILSSLEEKSLEDIKKFEDSQMMNLSISMENSKKLELSQRKSVEAILENSKKIEKSKTKYIDLEKTPKAKIFDPFKIKENQMTLSSKLQKTLKLEGTAPKIFGPMRNNYFENQEKQKFKMYSLNNLPETKKIHFLNSPTKMELNRSLKLSEFLSLKKNKQPNKLEQALDINESLNQEAYYGGMIQSCYGTVNKESLEELKAKNYHVYYVSERNFRGKIIEIDYDIFEHTKISGQSLTKLKLGCLKNKSNILENELLQIGCIATLERNDENKDFLTVTLYITNKSSKKIVNGDIGFIGDSGVNLWIKPERINPEIKGNGQIRQELIIDFNELPYPLLIGEYSFRFSKKKLDIFC